MECTQLALATEMGEMDKQTLDVLNIPPEKLMYKAAFAFFTQLKSEDIFKNVKHILILCGKGNNGGDGYVLSLLFAQEAFPVTVFSVGEEHSISSPAALHWYKKAKENIKIQFIHELNALDTALIQTDLIIDAVYGTGFHGDFKGDISFLFKKVAFYEKKKVAVDVPSGLNCDTGTLYEYAFKADSTITFEFLKPGLVSAPGCTYAGKVKVVPIGFTKEIRKDFFKEERYYLNDEILKFLDSSREYDGHKGNFGKVLCACGSYSMTGAAYFAAMGALKAGIGLLYLACPESILKVMQTKLNEPVFLSYSEQKNTLEAFIQSVGDLSKYKAIIHGCGSGLDKESAEITKFLVKNAPHRLVLDGDALNVLAQDTKIIHEKKSQLVLTPHPKEMARLIGKNVDFVQKNRLQVAVDFAKEYNCSVILKGARTIIAMADKTFSINSSGNPGMAKGGSGDILAGLISGFCAYEPDLYKALCVAVYLHGRAGDICKEKFGERAMLPSEMLEFLG